jgi:hypothetical protein
MSDKVFCKDCRYMECDKWWAPMCWVELDAFNRRHPVTGEIVAVDSAICAVKNANLNCPDFEPKPRPWWRRMWGK